METRQIAERALELMKSEGFDDAQVSASVSMQDELNIERSEPSMLRSTETCQLALLGLLDGRKASSDVCDTSEESVRRVVTALYHSVQAAPQDAANAVSGAQRAHIVRGPEESDLALLTAKTRELLEYRAAESPRTVIQEGQCAYFRSTSHTLTSRDSQLRSRISYYVLSAMGTAKDGKDTSSINYTGGSTLDLREGHAAEFFGIGEMLKETERQIHTRALGEGFIGDVVLTPGAVGDLLSWLRGQVSDFQLISDSSLYKQRVGEPIASPLLSVRSRFDGAGVCAISADAFAVAPVTLVDQGTLVTLLPSLYGSRKTGLPHVPSVGNGWTIDPGNVSRAELIRTTDRGALVGRLSMGSPSANGDMAGIIKNSFLIENGSLGAALAETMISGNIARMLRDIAAISSERIDRGGTVLPWIRIPNLHFS